MADHQKAMREAVALLLQVLALKGVIKDPIEIARALRDAKEVAMVDGAADIVEGWATTLIAANKPPRRKWRVEN